MKSGAGLPTRSDSVPVDGVAAVVPGELRLGGVVELPLLRGELGGGGLDRPADQELVQLVEPDPARAQDLALSEERPVGKLLGEEGEPVAVGTHGLHAGRRRPHERVVGELGGGGLVGVEPGDPGDPVAGDLARLETDFDPQRPVVHLDQAGPEVIPVGRAEQVRGGAPPLLAGEREQTVILGPIQDDGPTHLVAELHGLDLRVRHENVGRPGVDPDAVLVDLRHDPIGPCPRCGGGSRGGRVRSRRVPAS